MGKEKVSKFGKEKWLAQTWVFSDSLPRGLKVALPCQQPASGGHSRLGPLAHAPKVFLLMLSILRSFCGLGVKVSNVQGKSSKNL